MNLVIVESPYAGDVDRHVRYARLAMADCLIRGEAPIASHLLYPQILDDADINQRTLGITAGLAWASVCDYAVFYVDLGWSAGMLAARKFYRSHGLGWIERELIDA